MAKKQSFFDFFDFLTNCSYDSNESESEGERLKPTPLPHMRLWFVIFRPYFIWERKIFKSNGFFFFFLQNLPRFYLYLNLRVLPIEFNPHKFSFVRYVFVEIFEVFLKNDENDPLMTK